MNNKIYIAGKVTGDLDYKEKFNDARFRIECARTECTKHHLCLRNQCMFYDRDYVTTCRISNLFPEYFDVVNPAKFPIENRPWLLAMVYCISRMLKCHYVFMLRDWKDSRGAKVEHWFAKLFHKSIIYQQ